MNPRLIVSRQWWTNRMLVLLLVGTAYVYLNATKTNASGEVLAVLTGIWVVGVLLTLLKGLYLAGGAVLDAVR
jgi:hypothetical protein